MKKLIIEVRVNEAATKAANVNTPYTSDEIVAEGVACAEAGAAVIHFHARNADGSESNATKDFRDVVAGVRARSNVLIHPTLGRFENGADGTGRMGHIREMVEESNLRPDIAPLDLGSNNIDAWDPATKKFLFDGFVYQNNTSDLRKMAEKLKGWGIKPQLAIWTVPGLRLLNALIETGYLQEPVYPVLFLSSEGMLAGHQATSAGLRAFLDALPPRKKVEWSVLIHGTSFLPLLPEIIGLGGHVSIGLGDYAYPELGTPRNADLVRRVVEIAKTMGREIATPTEARQMLWGERVAAE